ncbi:MAG: hypothetical protein HFG81_01180 [Dorea sp.]|mgnify:CR=1 FL=1|jgi:hypothetical protein|nr:hypothetical protein [Dorea sp.]
MGMNNAVEIMDKGFACLVEKLGVVNAERFIAMIKRDSFDYTIWRKEYFKDVDLEEIREEAVAYDKSHPFKGKAVRL